MKINPICLPYFRKDIKDLKKDHIKGLSPQYNIEMVEDSDFIANHELLESIKYLIENMYRKQFKTHVQYEPQPFITYKIEIWKYDCATDTKGSSGGLRFIYCIYNNVVYFVLVKKKKDCIPEKDLLAEIKRRIKRYFDL
ncbi:MAG: hypothetical protein WCJ19_03570 [bacterium]